MAKTLPVAGAALLATAAALTLVTSACDKKKAEVGGVGTYMFGQTKRKDVGPEGRCLPPSDGIVQCIMQKSIVIGAQPGMTYLYFGSDDPQAPLLEVSVVIRGCQLDDAAKALETQLGAPSEVKDEGKSRFWRLKHMFVAARLPVKGGVECHVNFVDPKDTKRIEDLIAGE